MARSRKPSLLYRILQIRRHNRTLSALGTFLGALWFDPQDKVPNIQWWLDKMKTPKHLLRWSRTRGRMESPPQPAATFYKSLVAMSTLKPILQHSRKTFIVDAQGETGPVIIVGQVMNDGSLRLQTLLKKGMPLDPSKGPYINITKDLPEV